MRLAMADDLSGAAEIAGIGWRHGLEACVCLTTRALAATEPGDLCVIDLDSRTLPAPEAARRLGDTLRGLPSGPTLCFLKTDSVLRGNPGAEIEAALRACGLSRALLLAGNPESRRLQREGRLWVEDRPLAESGFSRDPIHPARHSQIAHILEASGATGEMHFLQPGDPLPARGILIGRMQSQRDLRHWAARLEEDMLPCGGGAFFAALLERDHAPRAGDTQPPPASAGNTLYVCGSAHAHSARQVADAARQGMALHYLDADRMPPEDSRLSETARILIDGLRRDRRALLAVRPAPTADSDANAAARLREAMARIAERTLAEGPLERLCIEGGATARTLLERLDVRHLQVEREWDQGVVALRPDDRDLPNVILKPGSYSWPRPLGFSTP